MSVVDLELEIGFLFQLLNLFGDVPGLAVAKEFGGSLKHQLHLVVAALHLVQLIMDALEGIIV